MEPREGELAYGFSLPATAAAPVVAHETAELLFDIHRVYALAEPGLALARELTAYACRFAREGQDVHLTLHQRAGTLRLDVYDPHACTGCAGQRHDSLRQTRTLVRPYDGVCGFGAAERCGAGTRTWATLTDTPRRWAA